MILLPGAAAGSTAEQLAARLVHELARPICVPEHEFTVSASVGVACLPTDGGDVDTLTRHADKAMYRAKRAGRNCWERWTPEPETSA